MLVAHVGLTTSPEQRAQLLERFAPLADAARDLDGCSDFQVLVDPADDARVVLYEEWRDADAFEHYKTTDGFAAMGELLTPMLTSPPDARYHTVVDAT